MACSKLGLWEEAWEILQQIDEESSNQKLNKGVNTSNKKFDNNNSIVINDKMITSFTKACTRASRSRSRSIEERRKPLDLAKDVLLSMEEKYQISLLPRHALPIASAYQNLNLNGEAETITLKLIKLVQKQNNNSDNKSNKKKKKQHERNNT